uniref:hypothetical protein n=1 Tax=Calidifontibacillus oryziterrae TaxID=1191699 RepID=UPI0038991161
MSKKGDPYDNACIESFHATIKKELIYRSTLGNQSPNQFERIHQQNEVENIS